MGIGDRRSKRGKIWRGSNGKTRPKNSKDKVQEVDADGVPIIGEDNRYNAAENWLKDIREKRKKEDFFKGKVDTASCDNQCHPDGKQCNRCTSVKDIDDTAKQAVILNVNREKVISNQTVHNEQQNKSSKLWRAFWQCKSIALLGLLD